MTEPPTLVEFLFIAIYNIAILELIIRLLRIVLCIFLIKCGIIILKMQIDESFCVNCTSASQVTISDFDYILSICWEATNVKYQGISGKYAKTNAKQICKTNICEICKILKLIVSTVVCQRIWYISQGKCH